MQNKFYVYLLKSLKDGKIYTGCTANLTQRLKEHNSGLSQYTKGHKPWDLAWYAVFSDKTTAFAFEKYLKTQAGKTFSRRHLYDSATTSQQ